MERRHMKPSFRYVEEILRRKTNRLTSVQKVRLLPLHDRFHLAVVHTGGNLETLIFHIDFYFFVQSVRNMPVYNSTRCIDVKPDVVDTEAYR